MKIENKKQFNEYIDTLNKRGAKFDFDCCEIILLNGAMLMRDKNTMNRFLVDTRTGDCFWLYNEEVHKDNVLLENESEAWAIIEIRQACRNLPKHKAEKVMQLLEDKDNEHVIFASEPKVELEVEYGQNYTTFWQKQVMCDEMPCNVAK